MGIIKTIGCILVILFIFWGIHFIFEKSILFGIIAAILILGIPALILKKMGF